jgi:hypothetical protein
MLGFGLFINRWFRVQVPADPPQKHRPTREFWILENHVLDGVRFTDFEKSDVSIGAFVKVKAKRRKVKVAGRDRFPWPVAGFYFYV